MGQHDVAGSGSDNRPTTPSSRAAPTQIPTSAPPSATASAALGDGDDKIVRQQLADLTKRVEALEKAIIEVEV